MTQNTGSHAESDASRQTVVRFFLNEISPPISLSDVLLHFV